MDSATLVIVGWILSICVHEFGHAIVAYVGGDTSVKEKGYLTFNIFRYTDPGLTLIFPVIILAIGGIALPGAAVYIDRARLRNRVWESLVSLAGPASSALCAIFLSIPFFMGMVPEDPGWFWTSTAFLIQLITFSVILNLLPVPSFDGYGIIDPWLPSAVRIKMYQLSRYALLVVFGVLWMYQPANQFLWHTTNNLIQLLHVPTSLALQGYDNFKQFSAPIVVGFLVLIFIFRKTVKPNSQKEQVDPRVHKLYATATQLRVANRLDESISAYGAVIELAPDFAEPWHYRGLCYAMMGNSQRAMLDFDRALELNPKYAECWYNRACQQALQGRTEQALDDLAHAIQLNPAALKSYARNEMSFQALKQDPRFEQLLRP